MSPSFPMIELLRLILEQKSEEVAAEKKYYFC
jgi:hypothetical protein